MTVVDGTSADELLVQRFRSAVSAELVARSTGTYLGSGQRLELADHELLASHLLDEQFERYRAERLAAGQAPLNSNEENALSSAVFNRLFHFGRLQPLLDDTKIRNVTANGCDVVFVEYADGTKVPWPPIAGTDAELVEMLRDIGRRYGLSEREFNPAHPQLNLQLPDGSRLFAIAWVCRRPCLAIRRHPYMEVTLSDLRRLGSIDAGLESFLAALVRAGKNTMIGGATDAGKTTLLRAMATNIDPAERIVTIETELELGLDRDERRHPDCVALEAREPNVEGVGEVTPTDLVRASLRMNPGRVLVGEVRGAEAVPLLNCLSQGNLGSLSTIHADSSAGVFHKLVLYCLQAPEQLPMETTNLLAAKAIDFVVFVAKVGNRRFVSSGRQIVGADGRHVVTNEVFQPGPDGRAVPGAPFPADVLAQLIDAGYDADLHLRPEGWWDR
jgi:Flp pilus assembly CpaF family ATPase